MAEHSYFSCDDCLYNKPAENVAWKTCNHPEVKKTKFANQKFEDHTSEDWRELNLLVTDVLGVQVILVNGGVKNFEFPYQFDSQWIVGCKSFIERDFKTYDRGRKT